MGCVPPRRVQALRRLGGHAGEAILPVRGACPSDFACDVNASDPPIGMPEDLLLSAVTPMDAVLALIVVGHVVPDPFAGGDVKVEKPEAIGSVGVEIQSSTVTRQRWTS